MCCATTCQCIDITGIMIVIRVEIFKIGHVEAVHLLRNNLSMYRYNMCTEIEIVRVEYVACTMLRHNNNHTRHASLDPDKARASYEVLPPIRGRAAPRRQRHAFDLVIPILRECE
jgi:hypothetical protein